MALSILESDRVDRYEIELFISQVNFPGYKLHSMEKNENKFIMDQSEFKVN